MGEGSKPLSRRKTGIASDFRERTGGNLEAPPVCGQDGVREGMKQNYRNWDPSLAILWHDGPQQRIAGLEIEKAVVGHSALGQRRPFGEVESDSAAITRASEMWR